MTMKKLTALLLCALMLAPSFAACSEKGANESADPASGTAQTSELTPAAAETEAEAEELLTCSVPEDLKLGGQSVRILHFTDQQTFNINVEELTGELLNDAVLNSNQKVMDDLDCVFVHNENGGIEPTKLTSAYKAGDDIYEIVYGTQWKVAPIVSQHIFANLNEKDAMYHYC